MRWDLLVAVVVGAIIGNLVAYFQHRRRMCEIKRQIDKQVSENGEVRGDWW